jgi:hypothetical protein
MPWAGFSGSLLLLFLRFGFNTAGERRRDAGMRFFGVSGFGINVKIVCQKS